MNFQLDTIKSDKNVPRPDSHVDDGRFSLNGLLSRAGYTATSFFLVLYAIVVIYPLFWTIINSLKSTQEIYTSSWSLPTTWEFGNYVEAWNGGVSSYFLNSFIVSTSSVLITIYVSALCAYGLLKYRGKGANALLLFLIGGLLVSPEVSVVPLYELMQVTRFHDTYLALIVPYVAYRLPITILLIRAYFLTIPKDLDEAAYIDGYNSMQIFHKIYLPLSKTILITAGVLTAYYTWNEFLFAIIFIDSDSLKTIPSGLMAFRDALQTNWGVLLAGLVISATPLIVAFMFLQRSFIRGMVSGSVKG
ncbi:carbohydrate ABC transporter permease [Saccharospirillum alexandrii]|uniref:carbohydrate ABC transporter permease n=1 Tax=Saccharospirillum alexandrii TaxID=2448477 RepID=UPI000FDA0F7E|nr:carbohydrate ABC transporter permease [Saccharospirillum alexandrii]